MSDLLCSRALDCRGVIFPGLIVDELLHQFGDDLVDILMQALLLNRARRQTAPDLLPHRPVNKNHYQRAFLTWFTVMFPHLSQGPIPKRLS
jgi:hypothetical protein